MIDLTEVSTSAIALQAQDNADRVGNEYERGTLYRDSGQTAKALADEMVRLVSENTETEPGSVFRLSAELLDNKDRIEKLIVAQVLPKELYVQLGGYVFFKNGVSAKTLKAGLGVELVEWLVTQTYTSKTIKALRDQWETENKARIEEIIKMAKETPKAKLARLERESGQMMEALHYKNSLIAARDAVIIEKDAIIAELREGIVREPSGEATGFTPAEKIGLFSTDPEMFELQARLVKSDFEYACSLFGHTPETAQDLTALRQSYTECKTLYSAHEHMMPAFEAAAKFVIATLRENTTAE